MKINLLVKPKRLPAKLLIALAQYFIHSANSRKYVSGWSSSNGEMREILTEGNKWDKQFDLNVIDKVCKKLHYNYSGCAGTFWFHQPDDKHGWKIDDSTFPLAEFVQYDNKI